WDRDDILTGDDLVPSDPDAEVGGAAQRPGSAGEDPPCRPAGCSAACRERPTSPRRDGGF
ncbi:hypothetical protein, partial [Micromonospora sp. NPDC049679]|uniref:hypothetical protein n=1 Tax=Micromonospora sp. NPDC049679 TaxID=3155920 RepID=UPI0033E82494